MPPKKVANQQQSVKVLIDRINVLGENFRSRPKAVVATKRPAAAPDPSSPPKTVRFVEPTIPDPPRIRSDDLADNPYAQEIFMFKTNVHDVTTRIVLQRDGEEGMDKRVRAFKRKLYRMFAKDPKNRIRYPLDRVRFESAYYEYRFFLALHKPLHSDDEYQEYKMQLAAAGVAESWVQMRKNNRLLMYEDRIVRKLKSNFKEWSLKLDKLNVYLMDMHGRQPGPSVRTANEAPGETSVVGSLPETGSEVILLEQLLEHSNAKQRFTSHQIQKLFPHIRRGLQHSNDFRWLIFEDDELNKRFELGSYAPGDIAQETVQEEEVAEVVPLESAASTSNSSRPGSAASEDSEIAHMRSEMAMTQPRELTQLDSSRFADTQALLNVLEQQGPKVIVEEIPQRLGDVMVEELPIVTEELQLELSPMITPAQVEVIEVSDSPVREDDEVQIKEEFLYTLDYIREFTNIEQYMSRELKQKFPKTYEKKLTKLNQYIERYYKSAEHLFIKNTLPPGLRLLSRKERKERQAKPGPQPSTSEAFSSVSKVPPTTTQTEISPITDTPLAPRVPRKARLIVYEEDEDDVRPTASNVALLPETLPMPNSEDFLPPVCSTQLPGESLASPPRRRDTPFNSPSASTVLPESSPTGNNNPMSSPPTTTKTLPRRNLQNFNPSTSSTQQRAEPGDIEPPNRHGTPSNSNSLRPASSSSRVPTPAFDSSSLNATVIVNQKSPQMPVVSIKRELNSTSYEGEVEFVELPPNSTILIEDSITDSERFPGALLERQPSCMAAIPDNLRGMVSTLFRENRDTTLSQGSGASNGSGDGPADSQQIRTSTPSAMGFHQTLRQLKFPPSSCLTKSQSHPTGEPPIQSIPFQPFRLVSNPFHQSSIPPAACTTLRFLTRTELVSVRFFRHPSAYHQRHHLTVALNHRLDGISRLTITDHEVRKLLNLSRGDRGWQALVSILNGVNRFEYDRFRPASPYQFQQMSISEKILYLFFATFPECPSQGPGWLARFADLRNYCEGDGVRLEEFNCFRHTYGGAEPGEIDLSEGMDSDIVQRMREMKMNGNEQCLHTI